jgi:hypothetical protein
MNDQSRAMRPGGRGSFDAQDDGPFVPEEVVRWVHEQIARGCVTITLRQRCDEGETLVCTVQLTGDVTMTQEIAASLFSRGLSEGRYLRGPTLFVMYAFKDVLREHCDRKSFRVEGENFARSGETEAPTLAGINSMLMRHTDAATKIALGHTSHIIEQYKGLLAQRDRRISELEAEVRAAAQLRESLILLEHERAASLHRMAEDSKRSDFMREKLDLMFPVLTSKLLGGAGLGANPVIGDEMLKQFLGSLNPDQINKLGSILSPEQGMLVGELYMKYAARSKDADVAASARAQSQRGGEQGPAAQPHANGAGAPTGAPGGQ